MSGHEDIDAGHIDLAKVDRGKLLRAEERRRRAGDDYGEIDQYLSADEQASDLSTDESDAEEDEVGELITPELDAQIMKTLTALQSKDKTIYDSKVHFFSEEEIKKSQEAWAEKQKAAKARADQSMTLRDYQHKVMVEHGGVVDEDREIQKSVARTHVEEQEDLKNAFKVAVDGSDDDDSMDSDDEFLVKKQKTQEEVDAEEEDYKKFLLENMARDDHVKEAFDNWEEYKAENAANRPAQTADDAPVDDQQFLMNYVLNRGWIEKGSTTKKSAKREAKTIVDKEEDEQLMELTDKFESKYNFRFEEPGADQITSYPRNIEGSMRRKDDRRKLARERAKERKEEVKRQKAEELKQLKNRKRKEIIDKLKEIQGITGNKHVGVDNLDLDGDFDPSKFDTQMDQMFGDEYYENGDLEKPTWDADIDVGDIVSGAAGDDNDEDFNMDADYMEGGAGPSQRAAEFGAHKAALKDKVATYMDDLYQLDFEDIVGGDIPTRFKYAKVKPVSYGLTSAEILLADEENLSKYVSVKRIAPYRPEWKIDEDMSQYLDKKRMIYVKKKARHNREEWDAANKKRKSGDSAESEKPSKKSKKSKKDNKEVKVIVEPAAKVEEKKAEAPVEPAKKKSQDRRSRQKAKAKAAKAGDTKPTLPEPPAKEAKEQEAPAETKSMNRRARQKAKKSAAKTA
ncbi:Ribosome biogenesis protein Kri1 [Linderina macrospora]|uniref:Ribosome biogenesis protein Kri1 n=1 Tax=Linderina macrospora TaxID=4868 RepID=A0ACC1JHB7_9FUNG|nr:Ribosome biogenesis protein Kri1 [Linderina macrospora]